MERSCTITSQALARMVAHAESERPRECCGILLGQGDDVAEAVPVPNIADSPDRFLLDPVGHIRVRREARARGLSVVGFYHSHPYSPAVPSKTDMKELAYPECLHAIVSLASETPAVRVFVWREGRPEAVRVSERAESGEI